MQILLCVSRLTRTKYSTLHCSNLKNVRKILQIKVFHLHKTIFFDIFRNLLKTFIKKHIFKFSSVHVFVGPMGVIQRVNCVLCPFGVYFYLFQAVEPRPLDLTEPNKFS